MRFDDEFKDKVVIITGSAGGLGKETAVQFAEAGAQVVIADMKTDLGKQTADEINKKNSGRALFCELNVTDEKSVQDMVKNTVDTFGTVDILINSAGISRNGFKSFNKVDLQEWNITYSVNVTGTASCCKAVFDIFKSKQSGKIVNVSSVSGRMPAPGMMHYAASKAAVISLTQSMAAEMARHNVNVNAVCPGWIWTPIYNESEEMKAVAQKMGKTPHEFFMYLVEMNCQLKREQTEQDIANAILFLSSEAAKNITGQTINVDGGAVMS